MAKLREEEIVCAEMLLSNGRNIRGIASELGIDESTLRIASGDDGCLFGAGNC
jgi:hypothetical protein